VTVTTPVPHDESRWAKPISRLKISDVPSGATNLNLDGRQIVSPLQGFGALWQKTYRLRLEGISATAAEVMRAWKENFPKFQPPGNHFYPPLTGINPGQVIFIRSTLPVLPGLPGLVPIAAGVVVIYEDDECFTIMTPEGFPESGWNTFSVREEDGVPVSILQFRLWDIDILIRRTLHYSILSGLLALIYFGLIVILQSIFTVFSGGRSELVTVASTLAMAALFFPLRNRVQAFIDRRFYRQKYNAQKVLAEFAATCRDETDIEKLTARLVEVVGETMQPEQVNVWLKPANDRQRTIAKDGRYNPSHD
jgi:hypothetical protein